MPGFKRYSPYQTTDDQPQVIAALVEGFKRKSVSDSAGCHRFGQNVYHVQYYCGWAALW